MKYIRKTIDEWQLWANYGYGWEHEVSYSNRKDAIADLRAYRENALQGSYKLLKKRVKKN